MGQVTLIVVVPRRSSTLIVDAGDEAAAANCSGTNAGMAGFVARRQREPPAALGEACRVAGSGSVVRA